MLSIDDYSRLTWVASLRDKLEAFKKFKIFKNKVENEFGVKVKSLKLDREGELTSREFNIYCEEHGIRRQLSSPHAPEQNVISKRRSKSIAKVARAMLLENDVPKTFWREVVNIVVYTPNRVQIRKCMDKTPYE